ncbi:hypothetical protein Pmani_014252 [Petrolisthes manimaculis]|uniref:Uncharacterized protein n=1 Tax=Petrolisthes manimaculis TaxID=1843537 RepID=A0AAE1U8J7_9EUCA|nr:hypothetical protein Pmani_014252 [Petrolisthes manimaculis]
MLLFNLPPAVLCRVSINIVGSRARRMESVREDRVKRGALKVKYSRSMALVVGGEVSGKVGAVDGVFGAPVVGGPEVDVEVLEAVLVDEWPPCDVDVLFGAFLYLEDDALTCIV